MSPSNSSTDIFPYASSPRFILNRPASWDTKQGTNFSALLGDIPLAPLGPYAEGYTRGQFMNFGPTDGDLLLVNPSNTNAINQASFVLLSCDPTAFSSGNLSPSDLFNIIYNKSNVVWLMFYSQTENHCNVSEIQDLTEIGAIFTVVGEENANRLIDYARNAGNGSASVEFIPDARSFTNTSNWNGVGSGLIGPSPTTAVAMIILYSITGIITGLFVIIIITGAIRAHRHPERYGPRNITGRGRQSRAKGIARAMLETLPIVKFGDKDEAPKTDVEMNNTTQTTPQTENTGLTEAQTADATTTEHESPSEEARSDSATVLPDGTDAEGHLGCSICTEDFTKGEEVRVLPCNHKFHPECVDPWLLNVSGTCPLCRIDLRPKNESANAEGEDVTTTEGQDSVALPPPLEPTSASSSRRDTILGIRGLTSGNRDERIAALRRYRDDRRQRGVAGTNASSTAEEGVERRTLRDRLRDRFRVRTTNGAATATTATTIGDETQEETPDEDTMTRFERMERRDRRQRRRSSVAA